MTAIQLVARTRKQLGIVVVISALLWAGAVLWFVLSLEVLAGGWAHGRIPNGWDWYAAVAGAAIGAFFVLWRARYVLSMRRVAVWMEERTPSLQYALITASDPLVDGDLSLLEDAIGRSNVDTRVRLAVATPLIYSIVALGAMTCVFAAAMTFVSGHTRVALHDSGAGTASDRPIPSRLIGLSVRIVAPAYAGGSVQTVKDPSGVSALIGSSITVSGSGAPAGVGATLGESALSTSGRLDWQTTFPMPKTATTITLTDRGYHRVMAIIPIVDQPPLVTMTQPTRDTVWRHVPSGAIAFAARATDDVGLSDAHLEYTVTTGSGEIFKSHTASFGASRLGGTRSADIHGTLQLGPLSLTEGAVLSVRAVVSDNNNLTGPGTATSDTRTFRVARADEYDSLAVEAAPPPPLERSLLTERMLINSADSLFKLRTSLAAKEFVTTAGRIGSDQADLRKKVYNILYEQDEAGGTLGVEGDDEELDPQLVLNRDLKEAYDAMWDAERSLDIGELATARPFMTRALHALDRARLADRIYLRGRPPRVVVNVEKVRLTAKERGVSNSVMETRASADTASARLDRALDAALAISHSDPNRSADDLIRLRAQATPVNAAFAAALGRAVDALRAGADMTPDLVTARRALLGAPRSGDPSVPWSGSWSGIR